MNEALPKGWAQTTLGEACSKPQYGWTCPAQPEGAVHLLRTTDLSSGDIDWGSVPFCSEVPDDLAKYRVEIDDILISRAGSVGVSHRIRQEPAESVFASYLIRFRSKPGVLPAYVERFLQSDDYWKAISDCSSGIAIPNVNASKLAEISMPLPPTSEQRRIVTKLDALLAKVDASRKRLEHIPVILKRFRQAVLAAACDGRLTEGWRRENTVEETASASVHRIQSDWAAAFQMVCEMAARKRLRKPQRPAEQAIRPELALLEVVSGWFSSRGNSYHPSSASSPFLWANYPKTGCPSDPWGIAKTARSGREPVWFDIGLAIT